MSQFRARENVTVRTGSHIEEVQKDESRAGFGVCDFAVGNKACELVEEMGTARTEKGVQRILTDQHLRVLQPGRAKAVNVVVKVVYTLGDAADIKGHELPTTAGVAVQNAK